MKRNERNTYNSLKKTVTKCTLYVEIPTAWTHEARQAIHELLTIEKNMVAYCVGPDVITHESTIRYTSCSPYNIKMRQAQETADIDTIMADLRHTDYTWNGYKVTT